MAAKAMPNLHHQFEEKVNSALSIVAATETLWLTAPPTGQIRQQLKTPQLESIYESAYLRVFGYWEAFLEEVAVRWMAHYACPGYTPTATAGRSLHKTVGAARIDLHTKGNRFSDYLLWHNPGEVTRRVSERLVGTPVEVVFNANQAKLQRLAAVRHHIAHGSPDTKAKFLEACQALTGSEHQGLPGRALRAADISDALNTRKWIRVWTMDLLGWSKEIVK